MCLCLGNCVDKKIRGLHGAIVMLWWSWETLLLRMSKALHHLHGKRCECVQSRGLAWITLWSVNMHLKLMGSSPGWAFSQEIKGWIYHDNDSRAVLSGVIYLRVFISHGDTRVCTLATETIRAPSTCIFLLLSPSTLTLCSQWAFLSPDFSNTHIFFQAFQKNCAAAHCQGCSN